MSAETFEIVVVAKIDGSIKTQFDNIATASEKAEARIAALKKQLRGLGLIKVDGITSPIKALIKEMDSASAKASALLATLNKLGSAKVPTGGPSVPSAPSAATQTKLDEITKSADKAGLSIQELKKQIRGLSLTQVTGITNPIKELIKLLEDAKRRVSDLLAQMAKLASQQGPKLPPATPAAPPAAPRAPPAPVGNQGAVTAAQQATAHAKAARATAQAATAQQRLQQATAQAAAAQTRAQQAAQALANSQTRGAIAAQQLAAAQARAQAATQRMQQAAQQLNRETSSSSVGKWLGWFARIGIIGAHAVALAAVGDEYTILQNKLRQTAETEGQLETVTRRVFEVANETRSPVQATAQAFARYDAALQGLGKSQEDTLRLTTTLNKLFKIGGTTASEQAGAMLQLSQSFNSGVLNGDEFRSVSENMPKVVRKAFAETLGIQETALKEAASKGMLTVDVLIKSFDKLGGFADESFAKLKVTMGDGLEYVKNKAIESFGKLDKALGFTTAIGGMLMRLGQNMNGIVTGLAAVAASMLVAFGPAIIAMIATVGKSVAMFTLALASNPLGLLIVGLSTATAYLMTFGAEINVAETGFVSLKDAALGAIDVFVEAAKAVFDFASDAKQDGSDVAKHFEDKNSQIGSSYGTLWGNIKDFFNMLIFGASVAAFAVVTAFKNLPGMISTIFASVVNNVLTVIESMINGVLTGINKVGEVANSAAEKINLPAVFQTGLTVSLAGFKVQAKDTFAEVGNEVAKFAKFSSQQDYIGDLGKKAVDAGKKIAASRPQEEATRQAGKAAPPAPKKPTDAEKSAQDKAAKEIEKRKTAMEKLNGELENELRTMQMLQPERDAEARYGDIVNNLKSKGITLTEGEISSIHGKIKAIEGFKAVQSEMDRIYSEVTGPLKTYEASLKAIELLKEKGAISGEEYNRQILGATETYKTATDPMREYNKGLQDQFDLLTVVGAAQQVESQIQQVKNDMLKKNIVMSGTEIESLREKLTLLQKEQALNQLVSGYRDAGAGKAEEITMKQTALNMAHEKGYINTLQYNQSLNELAVSMARLKVEMGDATATDMMISSLGRLVESYKGVLAGLDESFSSFFQTMTDGFANSIGQAIVNGEDLGASLEKVAKDAVGGLISSLVKLGIQYVINATIGESVAATSTAASVVQAGIVSSAWASAAAMVSLASYGANAVPAGAAIVETVALSNLMSQVKGFEKGGYTGDFGRKEIAGVVHGREFVMNADATARNRPLLEAMNNGQSPSAAPVGNGSTVLNVTVNNNASGAKVKTETKEGPNGRELMIMIEDVVTDSIRSGGKIGDAIEGQYGVNRAAGTY